MQAEGRALQRDLHASEQSSRDRQQALEHERAKERTAHAIQLQQEKDNHPLKGSFDKLELDLPSGTLRCFFVPPKFLTIGAPQNLLWEEMHPDRLEWEIMEFVQTYYGLDSDRPVQALGREVLNPKGLRGEAAVSLLHAMQPARPTLWVQADRLDPGFCGLGVAIWGAGSAARYRRLGTVPNYTLAHHRSMAAEVMLTDQANEGPRPELIKDIRKLNDIEIDHRLDS